MAKRVGWLIVAAVILSACQAAQPGGAKAMKVLAAETFLADIAQNVAGDRVKIETLMPVGVDPHSFEPTPLDVAKVADSSVLVVNGAGFEEFLRKLLDNAGGQRVVIEASAGLTPRTPRADEPTSEHESDPHFWLDPQRAIKYVENIRDGFSRADPAGAAIYQANAAAYIAQLQDLDRWIADRVQEVPEAKRLLVTNHESLGYFADRYGFTIIGAVVPSVSTGSSPSAQQLAGLIDRIRQTGARAIFLEAGANPQLARQVAQETGIKVVTNLYTHSTSEVGGPAATYFEMMKANTNAIVAALK